MAIGSRPLNTIILPHEVEDNPDFAECKARYDAQYGKKDFVPGTADERYSYLFNKYSSEYNKDDDY